MIFFEELTRSKYKKKIQKHLPKKFQTVEVEASRGESKVMGGEVGVQREYILTSMLKVFFGESRVKDNIPVREKEIDLYVDNNPISIKTIKSSNIALSPIGLVWSPREENSKTFIENYEPKYPIMFVNVIWDNSPTKHPKSGRFAECRKFMKEGGIYYFPVEAQRDILLSLGKEKFFSKMHKHSRAVCISVNATLEIIDHPKSLCLPIKWQWKKSISIKAKDRWVKSWNKDIKFKFWETTKELIFG